MATPTSHLRRALVRLPAVVYPGQAVSLLTPRKATDAPFSLPRDVIDEAWRNHDGRIAAFGPGARVGCELHLMYDDVLDALMPTPPGVAHATGGSRVRLTRTTRRGPGELHPMCEVVPLEDTVLTPAREERLADEAELARELIERGSVRTGSFALEASHLDEELGGTAVCDPRCHPLFPIQAVVPECDRELSLWLAQRLPLSTSLRVHMLSNSCPLRRLQVRCARCSARHA